VLIRPFRDSDLAATADLLLSIRIQTGSYPPPYVPANVEGVTEWLTRYPAQQRYVAVSSHTDTHDHTNRIIGHVQLVSSDQTDKDLPAFLDSHAGDQVGVGHVIPPSSNVIELARLFVDPNSAHTGIGRALCRYATQVAHTLGLRTALCVLVTQESAIHLYRTEGYIECGTFIGVSGIENIVFVSQE
jgi:GNAT superfamily N-acetyltransferase